VGTSKKKKEGPCKRQELTPLKQLFTAKKRTEISGHLFSFPPKHSIKLFTLKCGSTPAGERNCAVAAFVSFK
jgi:hypothetical protein